MRNAGTLGVRFLMYDHIMEMVRLASPGGRKAGWHSLACGGVAGTPPRDSEPRSCSWGARHICDLKCYLGPDNISGGGIARAGGHGHDAAVQPGGCDQVADAG